MFNFNKLTTIALIIMFLVLIQKNNSSECSPLIETKSKPDDFFKKMQMLKNNDKLVEKLFDIIDKNGILYKWIKIYF